MFLNVERTLATLAAIEQIDEHTRSELGQIEVALGMIRDALYETRCDDVGSLCGTTQLKQPARAIDFTT